jgi:fatty-acyl-CoA synthase
MGRDRGALGTRMTLDRYGLRVPPASAEYGAASWLAKRAWVHPTREALVEGTRHCTYGELDARVTRLANALRDRFGIRRMDRVATLTSNCVEFVELFFATARISALLAPLNWRLAPPELDYQLSDSGAAVLFVGEEHAALAGALAVRPTRGSVGIGPDYEALLASSTDAPLPADAQARFAEPHLILYTAGTTGHPKGAVLTHANVHWNCLNVGPAAGLGPDDTTISLLPFFHSGGIGLYLIPTLYVGGRVAIMRKFEPGVLLDLVSRFSVRVIFGVPAIWLELLKRPDFDRSHYPSISYCISGGAPHPLAVMEAVSARGFPFLQGYGLTETAPGGTLMPADDWKRKLGSAGKPFLHAELRVVDENGAPCPRDEIGEVQFNGPNVFAGYWGRPDATAEAFTPDGWFRTGDLGRLDDEGFLTLVDRKKDMVISGGENVYSAEVEDVLFAHPAVAEAAIIGVPDERWGEAVCAIVALRPGARATAHELIAHCRAHLAQYKTPKTVVFVDALPRNAAGKVLKRQLRAEVRSREQIKT